MKAVNKVILLGNCTRDPELKTTPESIVVSLDMARKLKAAGWPQEGSLHYWRFVLKGRGSGVEPRVYSARQQAKNEKSRNDRSELQSYAAPTAEEILRRLPPNISREWIGTIQMGIQFIDGEWNVFYVPSSESLEAEEIVKPDVSLSSAAAAMYCYLAENNLFPASTSSQPSA